MILAFSSVSFGAARGAVVASKAKDSTTTSEITGTPMVVMVVVMVMVVVVMVMIVMVVIERLVLMSGDNTECQGV